MTEDMTLAKLKKGYEKFREKYSLPSFEDMNKDFDIEKLQEKETELLSREVREAVMEKNSAYLRFIEMFLNPSNAPMFFLMLVKNMDSYDRKNLNELYLELGKFEIENISLDNNYDESKDAEFIKKFYKNWQEIKKRLDKVLESVEKSWKSDSERKEKGYLG